MTDDLHSVHRILTIEPSDNRVEAELIDNVHQFLAIVHHDGIRVTAIESSGERIPWSSCPAGNDRLKALIGAPLPSENESAAPIDKAQQCTHLFDLAKLALTHAHDTTPTRYDIRVDARQEDDAAEAVISRNGAPILVWSIRGNKVVSPGPFHGHATTGRAIWPEGAPDDPDLIEAAILLRRALLVFFGRRRSKGTKQATQLHYMAGACLTFQPGVIEHAVRPAGFVDHPVDAVAGLPLSRRSPFER